MAIIKAVVRTAISFGVLSILFAVLISAQTAAPTRPDYQTALSAGFGAAVCALIKTRKEC